MISRPPILKALVIIGIFVLTTGAAMASGNGPARIEHANRELLTKVCEARLRTGDEPWRELRAELGSQLKNPMTHIGKLMVDAESGGVLTRHLGTGVVGVVYEVQTAQGPMALKLYTHGSLRQFARAILMQRMLGLLGVAPNVNGILSRKDALQVLFTDKARIQKFPSELVQFGLLMDKVDGVSTKNMHPTLAEHHGWDFERVTREIRRIERVLGDLRLVPDDGQVMVASPARVKLHDVDFFKWISDDGQVYSYDDDGAVTDEFPPAQPLTVDLRIL